MKMEEIYHSHPRPEMLDFVPDFTGKILEIGCGSGAFAEIFINKFGACDYTGLELVPEAAKEASKKIPNTLIGDFFDLSKMLDDESFDLIIGNDVFEHFPDHDELLNVIKKKLRKGGHLVASIPNVRHVSNLHELLFLKDWSYKNAGLLDRTHLRFFTEKSIKRWLESGGFEIVKMKGINRCKIFSSKSEEWQQKFLENILGEDTRYLQFGVSARFVG